MDVCQPNNRRTRLRGLVAGALLASGMTALAAPPPEVPPKRAAWLLPPQHLEPGDVPAIARGAIDDLPGTSIGSTPVVRTGKKAAPASPTWLSGVDPNVIPASGGFPSRQEGEVRTLGAGSIPPLTPNKSKIPVDVDATHESNKTHSTHRSPGPAMSMTPEQPQDPGAPLRGTAANGAPLMAGPPAYRWYGYGSVTPGANVYAPAGQYPKASSNWYSVTGATPGAFPVPVVNPYRTSPGSEPPSYTANPSPRPTMASPGMALGETPRATYVPPPSSRPAAQPVPVPGISPMPPIGSIGTGSMPPMLQLPPLPQPVGVHSSPPASEAPVPPKQAEPVGVMPSVVPATSASPENGDPVLVIPPTLPTIEPDAKKPVLGLPVVATKPAAPEKLPPTLSEDSQWQPAVPQGAPSQPSPDLFLQPGANNLKPSSIARGQMPDASRSDPVAMMIQGTCRGRAEGIDVRWTGSKKLTVCFEVRSQPEANRLVKDIGARPELAPYAIDFCVLVK